jgi:hypothetical protein
MRRHNRRGPVTSTLLLTAMLTMVLPACRDAAAPEEPNIRVFLAALPRTETSAGLHATGGAFSSLAAAARGGIPLEAVDSIAVEVSAIAVVEPGDSVVFATPIPLTPAAMRTTNFRTLPFNTIDSVEIARGRVPAGSYASIRLRFRAARITFNTTVVSRGVTFEPGTYPLDMVHGVTYAVDVPGESIRVTNAVRSVLLTFDAASSVNGITNTTTGNLTMNPILRR